MSLKDVCNYRSNENIPIDTLLNVLRREETLRLCPELQILYDSCGSHSPPSEIESEIQRIALLENGYCCCWLGEYWNTSIRYPYNSSRIASTVRNTTVWLRHFERFIDDEDVQTQVGHIMHLHQPNQSIPVVGHAGNPRFVGILVVKLLKDYALVEWTMYAAKSLA